MRWLRNTLLPNQQYFAVSHIASRSLGFSLIYPRSKALFALSATALSCYCSLVTGTVDDQHIEDNLCLSYCRVLVLQSVEIELALMLKMKNFLFALLYK